MKETKENKALQIAYFIILTALLVFRDLADFQYSKFILVVVCVFFMAVGSYKDLIYMLLFTFPFLCGIPGTYIISISLIFYIIKVGKINKKSVAFWGFAIIAELIASLWYPDLYLADIVQFLSFLGIMLLLIYDRTVHLDYIRCLKIFDIALMIVGLIIVIHTVQDAPTNWVVSFANGQFRYGDTYRSDEMVLALNANNLAYYCVIGIAISMLLFDICKTSKLFNVFSFLVFSGIGILSQSRTFILVTLGIVFLFLIFVSAKPKKMVAALAALTLIGVVGWAFLKDNSFFVNGLTSRFSNDDLSTAGGRTTLTIEYLTAWWSNIRCVLFGTGVVGSNDILQIYHSIHTGSIQFLLCYGLFGSWIMFAAILIPFFNLMKYKIRFIYYLPWIAIVVFTQTIQFLNPCFLMLPYVIGIYAMREGVEEKHALLYSDC